MRSPLQPGWFSMINRSIALHYQVKLWLIMNRWNLRGNSEQREKWKTAHWFTLTATVCGVMKLFFGNICWQRAIKTRWFKESLTNSSDSMNHVRLPGSRVLFFPSSVRVCLHSSGVHQKRQWSSVARGLVYNPALQQQHFMLIPPLSTSLSSSTPTLSI